MDSGRHVVLMTNDSATMNSVAAALKSAKDSALLVNCTGLPHLVVQLEKLSPMVALVDVDPDPRRILSELDPILARFNQTRFVVLSSEASGDLLLEAMQIGARHLLQKRMIESGLAGVLGRFVSGESLGPKQQGLVVSVFSAGGGCGATTLALNLAHEVQLHTARSVLLVDLDDCYGALAACLDLDGDYGVADVLARKTIDEELIRTTAAAFSDRLHVLLSPASARSSRHRAMEFDAIDQFLAACRRAYSLTVLDAPRLDPQVAGQLARSSNTTFLMLQLSVKDIRAARVLLKSLTEQGVPPESITLVVSRYHRRSIISISQAREALGRDALVVIGSDYRHSLEAMTYAQPLAEVAPRSPLRKELRQLALEILEMPAVAVQAGSHTGAA